MLDPSESSAPSTRNCYTILDDERSGSGAGLSGDMLPTLNRGLIVYLLCNLTYLSARETYTDMDDECAFSSISPHLASLALQSFPWSRLGPYPSNMDGSTWRHHFMRQPKENEGQ
jgi:hypothetical protein